MRRPESLRAYCGPAAAHRQVDPMGLYSWSQFGNGVVTGSRSWPLRDGTGLSNAINSKSNPGHNQSRGRSLCAQYGRVVHSCRHGWTPLRANADAVQGLASGKGDTRRKSPRRISLHQLVNVRRVPMASGELAPRGRRRGGWGHQLLRRRHSSSYGRRIDRIDRRRSLRETG